jgi:parallel beta-helix repeat protein
MKAIRLAVIGLAAIVLSNPASAADPPTKGLGLIPAEPPHAARAAEVLKQIEQKRAARETGPMQAEDASATSATSDAVGELPAAPDKATKPRMRLAVPEHAAYLPAALRRAEALQAATAPLPSAPHAEASEQTQQDAQAEAAEPPAKAVTPGGRRLRATGLIPAPPPHAPRAGEILQQIRQKRAVQGKLLTLDKGPLANPPSADNSAGLPPVGDQGAQGSCVSWALGYYCKGYQERAERAWDVNDPAHQFSPAFLYNQLQYYDEGSTFPDNLDLLADQGCASMAQMPYDDADYRTWPSADSYKQGIPYRTASYDYLGTGETPGIFDAVKAIVADGGVCNVGLPIYRRSPSEPGLFDDLSPTNCQYFMPGADDKYLAGYHALTIAGYDESKFGGQGGYKIVNSWGASWGTNGFAWLSEPFLTTYGFDFYRMTDRIGYVPTAFAHFKVNHPFWYFDNIIVTVGVGPTTAPFWSKPMNKRLPVDYAEIDRWADISEAVAYLPPDWTNRWWIRIEDDQEGDEVRIEVFDIEVTPTLYSGSARLPVWALDAIMYGWNGDIPACTPAFTFTYVPCGPYLATNYYVNDSSTNDDQYCTAVGKDSNDGLSPQTPLRQIQTLLERYRLKSGDRVWIDSGTYLPFVVDHFVVGSRANPVRFIGPTGAGRGRISHESGDLVRIIDTEGISFENLSLEGGTHALYAGWVFRGWSDDEALFFKNLRMKGSSDNPVYLFEIQGAEFDHCLISEFQGYAGIDVDQSSVEICSSTIWVSNGGVCVRASGQPYESSGFVSALNSIFGSAWANGRASSCFRFDMGSSLETAMYNNFFAGPGATIGCEPDQTNLRTDPLFADPAGGDFHPKSMAGRWNPAGNGGVGAWVIDAVHSPCIDAGDPSSLVRAEPSPNGSRRNQGVYGGTAEASKSAAARFLYLSVPAANSTYQTVCDVTWQPLGTGWQGQETVRLEFSANGGSAWEAVADATNLAYNAASFSWNVRNLASGTNYFLRILCNDVPEISVQSGRFTVRPVPGQSYYVNDGDTTNDVYCTALGDDGNDGLTPNTPKGTVQAVIDGYTLRAGDKVYIDSGLYGLTNNILLTAADQGGSTNGGYCYVTFQGSTKMGATIIDRGSTNAGTACIATMDGNLFKFENLTLQGAYDGIRVADVALNEWPPVHPSKVLTNCRLLNNVRAGVCLDDANYGGGGQFVSLSQCLVVGNGQYGVYYPSGFMDSPEDLWLEKCVVGTASGEAIYWDNGDVQVRNCIIRAGGTGHFALKSGSGSYSGDFNNFFLTNGALLANGYATLVAWQAGGNRDQHSIGTDPLFADPTNGDYHLKSAGGRWDPAANGGAGDWVLDAETSPCVDRGNPLSPVGYEPEPNGDRVNIGLYGGTAEASKSPPARTVELLAPEAGTAYSGSIGVSWYVRGSGYASGDTFRLEFSPDGGSNWSPVTNAAALPWRQGAWGWDTTGHPDTRQARLRIVCNQDESVTDQTDDFAVRNGTVFAYYVNDSSTNLDAWCTAAGDDGNDGMTPATPKATVQAILAAYDLEPGDTVRIDTGTYATNANIVVGSQDQGVSGNPVVFEASPYGVTFNRGSTASGNYCWQIAGANYVTLRTATNGIHPGATQRWMRVTGAERGISVAGTYCRLERLDAVGNLNCGIYIGSAACTVEHCMARGNTHTSSGAGIHIAASSTTVSNCTATGNGKYGVYIVSYSGTVLRNNVISADGSGDYAVYSSSPAYTPTSDYNNLWAANGALVGYSGADCTKLADWRATTGQDANSLSRDTLFVDPAGGDYHLQSTAGSYHGGAWTADGGDSPGLDTGYGDAGAEPVPNASPLHAANRGMRNLGAYGGIDQGSKTPTNRLLWLYGPIGGENYTNQTLPVTVRWTWAGTNWQGGETVKLEYSANSGLTWTNIAGASAVPVTDGHHAWDISAMTPGRFCRVRVTCNEDAAATDTSPTDFRIGSNIAFYVNDGSTNLDAWCTEPGDDANDGITPSTPKATVQAVLAAYDLEPGDTVRIDTGNYETNANIAVTSQDQGASGNPVVFVASPYGVTFNRSNTASGSYGWHINGANYVTLRTAESAKHPSSPRRWMQVTGANYGIYVAGTYCRMERLDVAGNEVRGIYIAQTYSTVENCLARGTASTNNGAGIYIGSSSATLNNCTVTENGKYGVYLGSSGTTLRNTLICADGADDYAVYRGSAGYTLTSDYNDLFTTNAALVGYSGGNRATLADWQTATSQDAHSLTADPVFADAATNDYHIMSTGGRWYPAMQVWTNDSVDSPCLDAGDPASTVGDEPQPNGARINIGAYGGTAEASKTTAGRRITITAPNGGETWKGIRTIRWQRTGQAWQPADTVALYYSTNSGAEWVAIPGASPILARLDEHEWNLYGYSPGTQYMVKAVCEQDASVWDMSDTAFSVTTGGIYFVNDSFTNYDRYCTAPGTNSNDGLTPSTPLDSMQAVLDAYDLGPGDTIFVDAGEYALTSDVKVAASDSGDASGPVRIQGVPGRTLVERAASGSTHCMHLDGADYVEVLGFTFDYGGIGVQIGPGSQHCRLTGNAFRGTGSTAIMVGGTTSFHTLIEHNTIAHSGTDAAVQLDSQLAYESGVDYQIRNNTIVANKGVSVEANSGVALTNNIIVANGGGGYCVKTYFWYGHTADYNDLLAENGALTIAQAVGSHATGRDCATLAEWTALSGQDVHSRAIDPLFADRTNGDYHLKSAEGRWDPSLADGYGNWTNDLVTSPCIDAGDPGTDCLLESSPNGDRINIGACGGTEHASKSPSRWLVFESAGSSEPLSTWEPVRWSWRGTNWTSGETVHLDYSGDSGSNWTAIGGATGLGYGNGHYWWDTRTVPNASTYRFRVVSDGTPLVADAADRDYAVDNNAFSPVLSWTGEPGYETNGVNPDSAVEGTTSFVFRVSYADGDNHPPASNYPALHIRKSGAEISGSPFTMTVVSAGDTNYVDGKLYTYTHTNLVWGNDYAYNFEAMDTHSAPASGDPTVSHAGPLVIQREPGEFQFDAATYAVAENGTNLTITVLRIGGSNVAVTVNYATSNGTAMAGQDYTTATGTLAFGVGITSRTFSVTILDDAALESDETVHLTLSNPTGGATLGEDSAAVLTILDNDTDRQLAITYPNGGEVVDIAAVLTVTWNATGADWTPGDHVKLEWSGNAGVSWTPISGAESLAYDAGSFGWNTAGMTNGSAYRVRVSWLTDPVLNDASDANFRMRRCCYVNDGSTNLDAWCTAAGVDGNDGLTPATPKASVQAVLAAYDLEPGDTVRIDTGDYGLSANIAVTSQDQGASGNPVVFEASPFGVTFSRGSTASGAYGWHVNGANYVTLRTAQSAAHPGVTQRWMRVTGGYHGVYVAGTYCRLERVEAVVNLNYGVYIASTYATVQNCLARGSTSTSSGAGIYVASSSATVSNCTVAGNGKYGVYQGSTGLTLRNNVICADGSGDYAVYRSSTSYTLTSDYNALHAVNAALVGYSGADCARLTDWRAATGQDANSLSREPLFVDAAGGDYHLQSTAGSYHGGAWTAGAGDSPGLDTGYGDAGAEPEPNASPLHGANRGMRNLGAYGGTEQGSKTPANRLVWLYGPIGGENYVNQATPVTVRWTWAGTNWQSGDTVKLEYSADSGGTWSGISGAETVAATNGQYAWDISGLAASPLYRVRVTCNEDAAATDASASDFRIGSNVAFYVNDGSTNLDAWCTAPGNDGNDGLTPATPRATVQAILAAYDLEPGDTVRIDTGDYGLSANIAVTSQDQGASGNPVVFEASPYGVTINRGSTASSSYGWHLNDCDYVTVRTGTSAKHTDAPQRWARVTGGYYGLYLYYANYCLLERLDVASNANHGIYAQYTDYATYRNNLVRQNGDDGVYLYSSDNNTVQNNTLARNADDQLNIGSGSSPVTLRNNIFYADGAGDYCIYWYSTGYTLNSDYNAFHTANGASVGYANGARTTLADWQSATAKDSHSLSGDPVFADLLAGDLHLKSIEGRYLNSWTNDTWHSSCIDVGDPSSVYTNEPIPNGSRINLGAYGNTEQASKSLTNETRTLDVTTPYGVAQPSAGLHAYYRDSGLTCWISGSPVPAGAGVQYACVAAQVTGNAFTQVSPTNVTLTLTNDATLVWQWQTEYRLTTGSEGDGTVTPADGWYASGASTTLTATAGEHWHFSRWEGDTNGCGMAANVITAAMTQARSITAVFEMDRYTLTVSSGHGGAHPGTETADYGTAVSQWVTNSPVSGGVGTQYVCTAAQVAGNDFTQVSPTNVTLTLTNDATLAWQWQTEYRLSTATNGNGSVTAADGWYAAGGSTTLTATAGANWHFTGWTGDTNGCGMAGNVITAAMTQARAITANFAIDQHTLTVESAHGGAWPGTETTNWGTALSQWVTNSPVSGGVGTQYVCTAAQVAGNDFTQVSPTNVTLTLTNDATLAWQWQTEYWLNTEAGPNGTVDKPDQWVASGSNITITATASNYYHFGAWAGDITDCTIAGNQITACMDRPRAISASFIANTATNNTPHWWLAQYGLPTNDVGALFDEGDGMPAWQEYVADTDPTNRNSVLAVIGVTMEDGGVRIDWKGGQWATQYVENCLDLGSTDSVWRCIHTNAILPTPTTNFVIDAEATNDVLFYRIKVER